VVVCNNDHRFLVAEQLDEIDRTAGRIICEPTGRNTAPAIAVAALMLLAEDPDAVMLVMPSDHHIGDVAAFGDAVSRGAAMARKGSLVTFGIKPSRPEVGYGYIARGKAVPAIEDGYQVEKFIEKPRREVAEVLVSEGCLWNSGIFVLPAGVYMDELRRYEPDIAAAAAQAISRGKREDIYIYLDKESFTAAPDLSIDYAVMERTDRAAVVAADLAWSDIGSWHSLRETAVQDSQGNVLKGDVFADGVTNSYISANGRMVAAVGLRDVVIIDTDDAVLVTDTAHAADVGKIVERLNAEHRSESSFHRRVYRPWGYYESIDANDRFQVKHIMVKPGAQLSLQMHHHRHEHWVVVSGTGRVTCGDNVQLLGENGSAFIPLGTTHRLENPGKLPLHLIEVQVGAYLGEDDIVRFEDTYGRA
jgi:mannose-1-phosphate guanylyltransferase/mannose-6-phosphate isomerase